MKSLLLVFALIALSYSSSNFSCMDNNGNSVDWWVMLKLPKNFDDGVPFFYYDSSYG